VSAKTGKSDVVSILLSLERERATGVLEFRAERVVTRVFVEGGTPVFAEAGTHGETLGNVLLRARVITQEQFAAVVRRMTDALVDDENVRFGEVVVELGILTKDDLEQALATQVDKKIIGCVHRGEGEWSFEESASRVAEVPHHLSPVRALLVGATRMFEDERVEAMVALERFPRALGAAATIAEEFGLEDEGLALVEKLDGARAMKDVVAEAGAADARALVAALVLGGAVELLDAPSEKRTPSIAAPASTSGNRKSMRAKLVARDKAKAAIDRFIREREAPLPTARNEREATLFAEDEFQSGRRLLDSGQFEAASAKLASAASLAPDVALYALYQEFAESRAKGAFVDAVATKRRAIQMVKEDPEQAFAYYVLGHLALADGDVAAAKKFFRHAFKIDPELVDAGRQARLLEMRGDDAKPVVAAAPHAHASEASPAKPTKPAKAGASRTLVLAGALALVVVVAIAVVAFLH